MTTMPTSETGISTEVRHPANREEQRGFSLLELLVVVAIIGVFFGAAILSMGIVGEDREGEQRIARLKGVLDLAREEALMQSRDYGVFFTGSAYRFYLYDYVAQSWLPPTDDRLLTEQAIGDQFEFALVVEDREIVLDDESDSDAIEEPQPQVLILSSGEMTPFEASISRNGEGGQHVLTAEVGGDIEISSRGFATP